jgi:hypothetical protein
MAPNYLQRIAIAASRTGAQARPPFRGAPHMPDAAAAEPGPGALRPPQMSPDVLTEQAASDFRPRPTPPADRLPERARETSDVPAASLQPQVPAATLPPSGAEQVPAPPPAEGNSTAAAERSSDPSRSHEPQRPAPAGSRLGEPAQLQDLEKRSAPASILPPRADTFVIRAPRGLRPVPRPHPPEQMADSTSNGRNGQRPISNPPSMPIDPTTVRRQSGVTGQGEDVSVDAASLPQTATDIAVSPNALRDAGAVPSEIASVASTREEAPLARPAIPSAALSERTATQDAPAEVSAITPKPTAEPALPPGPPGGAGRESRITIGRVEVEVNNQLPMPPAASTARPSAPPAGLSALEARYLNRFFIRP